MHKRTHLLHISASLSGIFMYTLAYAQSSRVFARFSRHLRRPRPRPSFLPFSPSSTSRPPALPPAPPTTRAPACRKRRFVPACEVHCMWSVRLFPCAVSDRRAADLLSAAVRPALRSAAGGCRSARCAGSNATPSSAGDTSTRTARKSTTATVARAPLTRNTSVSRTQHCTHPRSPLPPPPLLLPLLRSRVSLSQSHTHTHSLERT